jgi:hypothetical protein
MLFLQIFMTNLVLTKSSGPKHHVVAFTVLFLPFSMCVTQISGGGARGKAGKTGMQNRASVCSRQKHDHLYGYCWLHKMLHLLLQVKSAQRSVRLTSSK